MNRQVSTICTHFCHVSLSTRRSPSPPSTPTRRNPSLSTTRLLLPTLLASNRLYPVQSQVVMGPRPATARGSMTTTEARGDGLRSRRGTYFGACGCTYHIRDDARVLYFDDPVLDDVMAITDTPCSRVRRCLCGGRGQAVRVQSRVCSGACVRARGLAGLPCMPTCCTCLCGSAAVSYDMPAKVRGPNFL